MEMMLSQARGAREQGAHARGAVFGFRFAAKEIGARGALVDVDGVRDGGADTAEVAAVAICCFLVAAEADDDEDGEEDADDETGEETGEDGGGGEVVAVGPW